MIEPNFAERLYEKITVSDAPEPRKEATDDDKEFYQEFNDTNRE